jgi:hypothetical protein
MAATTRVLEGMRFRYVDATEQAAADYQAGNWAAKQHYLNYYTKMTNNAGDYRYVHATVNYNSAETYYQRAEAFRVSDADKLDAIYEKVAELTRTGLKWVEV